MSQRSSKRTQQPEPGARRTRRGIQPLGLESSGENADLDVPEPAYSTRPTRRDIAVASDAKATPRGEISVEGLSGIGADVVSGAIERTVTTVAPRRRRTTSMPVENVHLAHATKKEIIVIIGDQALTLQRADALALAQIIVTTFG